MATVTRFGSDGFIRKLKGRRLEDVGEFNLVYFRIRCNIIVELDNNIVMQPKILLFFRNVWLLF